jgi:alpha-L-fucosidase 2
MHNLRYTEAAKFWEEALPLGNGRIGAMVYGGVGRELIQLNEDTLWTGGPADVKSYSIPENIDDVRQLIREGKYAEASRRTSDMMDYHDVQAYQLAGDLILDFGGDETLSDYSRSLDLTTAVAESRFVRDGVTFNRESFVSAPHQVVVMRLTADKPGQISFGLSAESLMQHGVNIQGS